MFFFSHSKRWKFYYTCTLNFYHILQCNDVLITFYLTFKFFIKIVCIIRSYIINLHIKYDLIKLVACFLSSCKHFEIENPQIMSFHNSRTSMFSNIWWKLITIYKIIKQPLYQMLRIIGWKLKVAIFTYLLK